VVVGVAGPVVDGRSRIVNLRWPVDEKRVARETGASRVRVLNDLEATGWGIARLPSRKLASLTPGLRTQQATGALIAAGTGLGMCTLVWDGTRHVPLAGEGGHQDFAPRNELEVDLLRHFQKIHGRVSVERIVAGPGMSGIYRFLVDTGRERRDRKLEARFEKEDPNAVVSEAGVEGSSPTARRAVEIFVSLYGAAAGNLALVVKATGGVWVGGGIAPKILPALRDGAFLDSFLDKGRLRPVLEHIPVKVILEPRTALLGAAAYAVDGF
jgi:glucokinase